MFGSGLNVTRFTASQFFTRVLSNSCSSGGVYPSWLNGFATKTYTLPRADSYTAILYEPLNAHTHTGWFPWESHSPFEPVNHIHYAENGFIFETEPNVNRGSILLMTLKGIMLHMKVSVQATFRYSPIATHPISNLEHTWGLEKNPLNPTNFFGRFAGIITHYNTLPNQRWPNQFT